MRKGLPTADTQKMLGFYNPFPNMVPKNKVPHKLHFYFQTFLHSVQPCQSSTWYPANATHRDRNTSHKRVKPQRDVHLTRASMSTSAPSSLSWRVSISVNSWSKSTTAMDTCENVKGYQVHTETLLTTLLKYLVPFCFLVNHFITVYL